MQYHMSPLIFLSNMQKVFIFNEHNLNINSMTYTNINILRGGMFFYNVIVTFRNVDECDV